MSSNLCWRNWVPPVRWRETTSWSLKVAFNRNNWRTCSVSTLVRFFAFHFRPIPTHRTFHPLTLSHSLSFFYSRIRYLSNLSLSEHESEEREPYSLQGLLGLWRHLFCHGHQEWFPRPNQAQEGVVNSYNLVLWPNKHHLVPICDPSHAPFALHHSHTYPPPPLPSFSSPPFSLLLPFCGLAMIGRFPKADVAVWRLVHSGVINMRPIQSNPIQSLHAGWIAQWQCTRVATSTGEAYQRRVSTKGLVESRWNCQSLALNVTCWTWSSYFKYWQARLKILCASARQHDTWQLRYNVRGLSEEERTQEIARDASWAESCE